MEGSEFRRSMTLSEQLSIEDSPNHKLYPPTVEAAGEAEKREAFANGSGPGRVRSRTLMDIIKEEHDSDGGSGPGINWKAFKDRLRRAGAAWATPSAPISYPDVVPVLPNPAVALGRTFTVRNAEMPFPGSASRRRAIDSEYNPAAAGTAVAEESDSPASGGSRGSEEEGEGSEGSARSGMGGVEAVPVAEEHPVRMSLMALLEQTDRWGGEGEAASAAPAEEEEVADNDGGRMDHVCCVCMVRHKGAAFIPCGHTFCRLCSRELWVSRGNCPLCNSFVLEILDIF